MKIETKASGKQWITIAPGEYYVTKNRAIIETLLGSCVAACLFDPVNRVAGMNHFLLDDPVHHDKTTLPASHEGKYGTYSMRLLINEMLSQGAEEKYLKAKAFGGGNVLKLDQNHSTQFAVGEVNVKFIKKFLRDRSIPLIASALGGGMGRVIRYDTADFAVYVKKIREYRCPEDQETG